MKTSIVLLLCVGLVGCGSSADNTTPSSTTESPSSGTELPPEPAPEAASGGLVLAELTMTDTGGQTLALHADGSVELDGGTNISIDPDGRVTADGEVIAVLEGNNVVANGQTVATISEDGTGQIGDRRVSFDETGALVGGNPDGPGMTLSPADTPARRAAMLLLIVITL